MTMQFNSYEEKMDKTLNNLKKEYLGLRTGRASASLLEPVSVEAYGGKVPINQVANISVPESRLITVQVWDESLVGTVENSIRNSELGLNPMSEGNLIRIPIPELSEERRKEIVKIASKYTEDCKIAVRNIRREYIENVRKLQKNGEISEDQKHQDEILIQEVTDRVIKDIDDTLSNKEKEILDN